MYVNGCEINRDFNQIVEGFPIGVIGIGSGDRIVSLCKNAQKFLDIKKDSLGKSIFDALPYFREAYESAGKNQLFLYNNTFMRFSESISLNNVEEVGFFTVRESGFVNKVNSKFEMDADFWREFGEVIENSFDGILVTDKDGVILLINPAYEKNTGINAKEWIGKNITSFVGPSWFKNTVVSLVEQTKSPVSMTHKCQNGKNIVSTGTPIFDDYGEIKRIVVNTRDVTEIYSLRERLQEVEEYMKQFGDAGPGTGLVAASKKMCDIFSKANHLGNFNTTVLITGSSGVGKEEVAKYIHRHGLRKNGPFIAVNCGAIPENLLESELFGYVEGAFTGSAKGGKEGLFKMADGGTLFLDEVGEVSPAFQVKLLRSLETKTIKKIGSGEEESVDIRIIAATNKDLFKLMEEGTFREDLLYRLNVINIKIPDLKERPEDIGALAIRFLQKFNAEYSLEKKIPYEVIREMEEYSWPGNVRELKNVVENMVVMCQEQYLSVGDLPWIDEENKIDCIIKKHGEIPSWKEATEHTEKRLIQMAFEKYKSIRSAAQALQMDHSTLSRKAKEYNINIKDIKDKKEDD